MQTLTPRVTSRSKLKPFLLQQTVLLVTYRRDGRPVGTPMSIAVEGDHAFIRSYETAGKSRRIRNNPNVEIAPSTFRGRVKGPFIQARARLLAGAEAQHASSVISRRYPFFQGILVRLAHRVKHYRTLHFELTPVLD